MQRRRCFSSASTTSHRLPAPATAASTPSARFIRSISMRSLPKIIIGIEGSGFLWRMVRIIVGTLVEVGLGKRSADEMPAILEAKIRTASGSTAPAHGLYLQWIRTRDGTEDSARKVESEESDA